MYAFVLELMDDVDVIDHEELQEVGDVKEGQVEGYLHLQYLHQESHAQVGDGANEVPPESTEESYTGEKLTDSDDHAVNIRFDLINNEEFD